MSYRRCYSYDAASSHHLTSHLCRVSPSVTQASPGTPSLTYKLPFRRCPPTPTRRFQLFHFLLTVACRNAAAGCGLHHSSPDRVRIPVTPWVQRSCHHLSPLSLSNRRMPATYSRPPPSLPAPRCSIILLSNRSSILLVAPRTFLQVSMSHSTIQPHRLIAFGVILATAASSIVVAIYVILRQSPNVFVS